VLLDRIRQNFDYRASGLATGASQGELRLGLLRRAALA